MMIDLDNRCTGKTTTLIHDAYFTGLPIIVITNTRKNNILSQAQTMGIDIKCYTVNELASKKELKGGQVLVDELEEVLNYCLGAKVVKATMSRKGSV